MPAPTTDLIHLIVECVPGIGRGQIIKLLYFIDLEARRFLGRPISTLDYIWYASGPFDSAVLSGLDRLCQRGSVRIEQVHTPNGQSSWRYFSTGLAAPPVLDEDEKLIVDSVLANYGELQRSALLEDAVCQSEPMQAAVESGVAGCRLPMELADNQLRDLGFEPHRVISAVQHLDAGRYVSHQELFERLRSQVAGSSQ